MSKKYDCLGIGLATLDYLSLVREFPRPGLKLEVVESSVDGGGPVPTALATLARLGAHCAYRGRLGDDTHGKLVLAAFRRAGVSTTHVITKAGRQTPTASVLVEKSTGRRTVLLDRGKGCSLTAADISPGVIKRTRSLHLDGRDLPACLRAARLARKLGVTTILDVGSLRNPVERLLDHIDHLVVAEEYALGVTGARKIERAAVQLFQAGLSSLVITMGEKGALGFDGRESIRQRAFRVKVKDVTGAGDSYHGAYIYGLLRHWPLKRRLRFAAAVAALTCRELGGRSGLPSLADTERLLKGGQLL